MRKYIWWTNMNRLKDLREEMNLNQTELAKKVNMSQTGYSKYEVGTNDIPTSILIKLADLYNTSIDYLLCRTDKREAYPKSILKEKTDKK